ncbi:MAG: hypothetical protein AABX11_03260 [Nanoarchaeota archaeon]
MVKKVEKKVKKVVKKATTFNKGSRSPNLKEKEEESSGGMGLDDAFGDDEGVEYAESKPRKEKKKKKGEEDEELEEELDGELDEIERGVGTLSSENTKPVQVKMSKPVSKVKKGDIVRIDGKPYEVDGHFMLIDHKTTKEMAIEVFDKDDRTFQIRYFDDQVEATLELYELQEIMFVKRVMTTLEW